MPKVPRRKSERRQALRYHPPSGLEGCVGFKLFTFSPMTLLYPCVSLIRNRRVVWIAFRGDCAMGHGKNAEFVGTVRHTGLRTKLNQQLRQRMPRSEFVEMVRSRICRTPAPS